jgi:hypothetical protein
LCASPTVRIIIAVILVASKNQLCKVRGAVDPFRSAPPMAGVGDSPLVNYSLPEYRLTCPSGIEKISVRKISGYKALRKPSGDFFPLAIENLPLLKKMA